MNLTFVKHKDFKRKNPKRKIIKRKVIKRKTHKSKVVKRKVIKRKTSKSKKTSNKKIGSFYRPTKKTARTGKCPKGKIIRKAYTRSDGTKVKAVCIKDKGVVGKTIKKYKVINNLKEGKLKKYGYSTKKDASKRLKALVKSMNAVGYDKTVERLTALRVLSRREPALKKKYDGDYKRLKRYYKNISIKL